ncbi:unnamed protein product [Linum trigynum]|uniref:Uncharacterized protein n=1 Tax=Linum trigynum TaxID=586398 RepID=A0AAV2G2A3_9ROSI
MTMAVLPRSITRTLGGNPLPCVTPLIFGGGRLIRCCSTAELSSSSAISIGREPALSQIDKPKLCGESCEKELENVPMVSTESGLQYKDIKVGGGPSPPVGFQIV